MSLELKLPWLRVGLFLIFILNIQPVWAQVNVTSVNIADTLVQKLVGTGITYLNPVLTCHTDGSATFETVSSNLGLDGGIILSSGLAETDPLANQVGANGAQQLFAATTMSGPGDAELSVLAGQQTHDACILQFDFVPDGDSLLFEYVFGSEEYDSYSCDVFNDAFGFFLSGSGILGSQNIALIPNTNIPVTINSTTDPAVTQPFSTALCTAMGPGSPFTQYYNDNSNGTSITYYGMTKVLTARAAVSNCDTYHIKLAIADAFDGTLDSGVFLKENSFRSSAITLTLDSKLGTSYNYLVEECLEGTITAKRDKPLPYPETILLGYAGNATRNVDYFNVPDSLIIPANDTVASFTLTGIQDNLAEGTEIIVVNVLNKCSLQPTQSLIFTLRDYLPIELVSKDTLVCEKGDVPLVVNAQSNFWTFNWSSNPPTGTIDNNGTPNALGHPDTSTVYTIVATFEGCASESLSFNAYVEPNPKVYISFEDTVVCLRDTMTIGAHVFPEWYDSYIYSWTPKRYLNDTTILSPKFFFDEVADHPYVLTVTSEHGCVGYDSAVIHTKPPFWLYDVSADSKVKYGESLQLEAYGADYYSWWPSRFLDYNDVQFPTTTPTEPTRYNVIGMNVHGCTDTADVFVDVDFGMGEFIPSAFTPNGDGKNDLFKIAGNRFQKLIEFRVFNRFGQEIFSTIDINTGWDGKFNGVPQNPGVFYYLIRLVHPQGKIITYKGDVTLLR